LERYAIEGDVGDWGDALKGGKTPSSGLLSVKRKPGSGKDDERTPSKSAKKEGKKDKKDRTPGSHKSHKSGDSGKKSKHR
jgi:hypothetical protein